MAGGTLGGRLPPLSGLGSQRLYPQVLLPNPDFVKEQAWPSQDLQPDTAPLVPSTVPASQHDPPSKGQPDLTGAGL